MFTKAACKPSPNKYHRDLWYNHGYVEYVEVPTKNYSHHEDTKVQKVVVSYGYTWKEQQR